MRRVALGNCPVSTLSKPFQSPFKPSFCAQSRFRKATFTLVGGADADQFSLGAEDVHYEGPLQIRLQVQRPMPCTLYLLGRVMPVTAVRVL